MKPTDLLGSLASLEEYCQVLNTLGHEQLRKLEAENQALNEQISTLSTANRALTEQAERLNELHLRAEQQAVAAEQLAAKLSDDLTSVQHAAETKDAEYRADIKNLTDRVGEEGRCNQELKLQLSASAAQIDRLRSLLDCSEEAKDVLDKRIVELVKLLDSKAEALIRGEQAYTDQQKQSEELQHQYMACTAQLDLLRHDHAWISGEKIAIQQRAAELEKLLDSRTEAHTRAETACKEQQDLNKKLLECRSELEDKLESMTIAHAEVNEILKREKERATDLEKTLSAIQHETKLLRVQNLELQNGLEISFQSDRDKGYEVDSLRIQVAELQSQVTVIEQERNAAKTHVADLQNEINQKRKESIAAGLHQKKQEAQLVSIQRCNRLLRLQLNELQIQLERDFILANGQRLNAPGLAGVAVGDHSDFAKSSRKSTSETINSQRSLLLAAF